MLEVLQLERQRKRRQTEVGAINVKNGREANVRLDQRIPRLDALALDQEDTAGTLPSRPVR